MSVFLLEVIMQQEKDPKDVNDAPEVEAPAGDMAPKEDAPEAPEDRQTDHA